MKNESSADELIEKHLDGLLSTAEQDELRQLLVRDTCVADAFYAAALQEERLRAHFRRQRNSGQMASILDDVLSVQVGGPIRHVLHDQTVRPRLRRFKSWQWSAAACLLVVIGVVSYFATVDGNRFREESTHEVVAGTVEINGVKLSRIPEQTTFDVTGESSALIDLADGSRAELSPGSIATIRGQVSESRQVVALHRGSGRFVVEKGESQFRVDTPAGGVTALGTEFTVKVFSDEEALAAERKPAMIVGVITGLVEVDYANETFPLALGDDRIFVTTYSPRTSAPDLVGKVISVSDDLDSIQIQMKKTREHPQHVVAVTLRDDTEFAWVNVPADRQTPSLGYKVSVWLNDDRSGAAAVRFSVEEGSGRPPSLTGRVVDVALDGRSITLELPRHTKSENPPVTRLVNLNEQTDAQYFFVRYDGEVPTVGYNATVWLQTDSADVARVIHYSGDKRGDYAPDLKGHMVDVAENGAVIEVLHRKSKALTAPNLHMARSRLLIGRGATLLYRDVPPGEQQPTIGHYVEVWLEPESLNRVKAARFRLDEPRYNAKVGSK
ncbi:MAG TPA: FecR family protein [Pirellulaceae bacterium]|nr:FecR family protein [Pirellulaceae bacterium]